VTSPTPHQARQLATERNDERVTLAVTSLTAIAPAIVGAAFVVPALANPAVPPSRGPWISMLAALALHLGARVMPRLLRGEE
jgi:hypothetical protein